jgi:hypothetical protein
MIDQEKNQSLEIWWDNVDDVSLSVHCQIFCSFWQHDNREGFVVQEMDQRENFRLLLTCWMLEVNSILCLKNFRNSQKRSFGWIYPSNVIGQKNRRMWRLSYWVGQ